MMNPDIYTASYRRVNVRGGKVYLPTLMFSDGRGGRWQMDLRGICKTATAAQKRAERFLATWKRWRVIWEGMPKSERVPAE